jgi:hypothetical protein
VTTSAGQRAVVTTEAAALIERLQAEEFVGRDVRIAADEMTP